MNHPQPQPRPTGRNRPRYLSIGGLAVVVAALVGLSCSSDDATAPASSTTADPTSQIADSDGDTCTDPTGDIGDIAGDTVEQGTLSDPAGIDLVEMSAIRTGGMLDVTFESAGPIDPVPSARFVLSQGQPFELAAYEIRAEREALGAWDLVLVSWETGNEVRSSLAATPIVEGNTLRFSVPTDLLPPIALYLAFGASAEVADGPDTDDLPDVVFDECSKLSSEPSPTSTTG